MQCERGMRVTMWEELSSKLFNSEQKSNCPETIQNNVVFHSTQNDGMRERLIEGLILLET